MSKTSTPDLPLYTCPRTWKTGEATRSMSPGGGAEEQELILHGDVSHTTQASLLTNFLVLAGAQHKPSLALKSNNT